MVAREEQTKMNSMWKQKIKQAIQEKKVLSIQYKKKTTGEYEQYEIVPLDIVEKVTKEKWQEEYVLAFSKEMFRTYPQKEDYRQYLLDNFCQIILTDKQFDPKPYVDLFSQIVKGTPKWNIPREW